MSIIVLAEQVSKEPNLMAQIGFPIAMFIGGFLVSRLTFSKKERKDHEHRLQENADRYRKALNEEFQKFTTALNLYADLKRDPNLQDFLTIAQAGETYFAQLSMIADATFAGTIRQDFTQDIKEAYDKSMPNFYDVLGKIAEGCGASWSGELRRPNYESIISYYEKYCTSKL